MEQIGHYRIVSELGRGGMGVVYKAHEESLNRFVAIKVLGEHLAEDPSYVQRFVREAQSAAKLSHPNIVQIYTIAEENGIHYFVMEYVSGTSLLRLLRSQGRMKAPQAARIILQAAGGLAAAHDEGVVHRDIKPANLMITDRGLVKIADFGLALLTEGASRLTATGMFMGTPGYLSPEQCLDRDVDARTDIYSLGVTYFETLTGALPFKSESPLALLRQIIEVEPPDVREVNPEVDETSRTILRRMMAKDRSQRYPNCHELISDLQRYLETVGASSQDVAALAAGTGAAYAGALPSTPAGAPAPRTARVVEEPTMPVSPSAAARAAAKAAPAGAAATVPEGAVQPPPPPSPVLEQAPIMVTPPALVTPAPAVRKSSTAVVLVVAAVLVLGLLGVGGAVMVAAKTGLLRKAFSAVHMPSAAASATVGEGVGAATQPAGVSLEETTPENAMPASEGSAGETASSGVVEEPEAAAAAVELAETEPVAPASGLERPRARVDRRAEPVRGQLDGGQVVPPRPEPAARGVAVIGIGDRLLAGEAEKFLQEALASAGATLVDENGLPAVRDLLGDRSGVSVGELLQELRPHVRSLVLVEAEYLGSRPLRYMNRSDEAYQARLKVTRFDVAREQAVGPGLDERVEYTQVSVGRVVEQTLRPRARRFVEHVLEDR